MAIDLHRRAVALLTGIAPSDDKSERFRLADAIASGVETASAAERNVRADRWVENLHRYERWWLVHGRTPREKTRNAATLPVDERHLGEWARYQRRFEANLSRYQVHRLDVSSAFEWDPQEAAWEHNQQGCVRHARETGALPRLNPDDRTEFLLARWLSRQLRQLQTRTLREARAVRLQELLDDQG